MEVSVMKVFDVLFRNTLLSLGLSLSIPVLAYANSGGSLQLEKPSLDTNLAHNAPVHAPKQLFGGVDAQDEKRESEALSTGVQRQDAKSGAVALTSEQPLSDSAKLYKQAITKLTAKAELSREEYRSLGAGCAGFESLRTFFQPVAVVTEVYPDSPADLAGLKKGDRLIDANYTDELAKEDPTKPLWSASWAQAGTPVTINVLRHHKVEPITLNRMNIEDITVESRRLEWEQLIRSMGSPIQGAFIGPSLSELKPANPDQ